LVMIICTNGISGAGLIKANGDKAGDTFASHNDGGSGGGGGGTVILKLNSVSSTQTVSAIGGDGGNQFVPGPPANPNESDGPGGGGGGGIVASSQPITTYFVSGGINGTTQSPSVTEFIYNGATSGASGQTLTTTSQILTFLEGGQNPSDPCYNLPTALAYRLHEKAIRVYPNPFSERFYIEGFDRNEEQHIEFIDLSGRIVHRTKLAEVVSTKELDSGIYFVAVSGAEGKNYIGKFIKE